MQMLHPDGHAPARPVEVPVLIAALGPKGNKVASELGDGLFATLTMPEFMSDYAWTAFLAWGTVLDEGEPDDSGRARAAGGPGWALSLHGAYEFGGPDAVRALPRGDEWLRVIEQAPERAQGRHAERNPRPGPADPRGLPRPRRHRGRLPAVRTRYPG
jgi:5,10-methylenetetrahydromethanopterin reductase